MKTVTIGIGVVLALIVLLVGTICLGYGIRYWTAPVLGKIEVQVQTHTAEYMMQAYGNFFDLKATVDANKQSLCNAKATLAETCDAAEQTRLRSVILGIKNQITRDVQTYNADAAKDWTVGQFLDWSLPASLSTEYDCDLYSQ